MNKTVALICSHASLIDTASMFAMCSCVYVHFGHACVEQNLLIKLTRMRYCYCEAEVRGSSVSIFEGSPSKEGFHGTYGPPLDPPL